MKKHILRMREKDRFVFDAIKKGKKSVETRAGMEKFQKIKPGDILVFVCGNDKIQKEVAGVRHFKTIDDMAKEIDFKKIMPFCESIEDMKKIYHGFPDYEEKIKNSGLVAFELK